MSENRARVNRFQEGGDNGPPFKIVGREEPTTEAPPNRLEQVRKFVANRVADGEELFAACGEAANKFKISIGTIERIVIK